MVVVAVAVAVVVVVHGDGDACLQWVPVLVPVPVPPAAPVVLRRGVGQRGALGAGVVRVPVGVAA